MSALRSDDKDALGGELLTAHDQHATNVVNVRAQIGTLYNRLEAAADRNETEKLNLTETLSNKQDVDIAEKVYGISKSNDCLSFNTSDGNKNHADVHSRLLKLTRKLLFFAESKSFLFLEKGLILNGFFR